MHRRIQFGMCENPASNRRYDSPPAVSDPLSQDCIETRNDSAPDPALGCNRLSFRTNDADNTALRRAVTGEENEKLNGSFRALAPISSRRSADGFEPLLTSPEAARLLGNIHVKTLQRYARLGRLPGYQIGGHWYFRESELDAWLRHQINSKCQSVR
jgi:excisionase family DNA binding protein